MTDDPKKTLDLGGPPNLTDALFDAHRRDDSAMGWEVWASPPRATPKEGWGEPVLIAGPMPEETARRIATSLNAFRGWKRSTIPVGRGEVRRWKTMHQLRQAEHALLKRGAYRLAASSALARVKTILTEEEAPKVAAEEAPSGIWPE